MGLYNFQPRFVARIKSGSKSHTIRAPRKGGREDKPGSTMYLYRGLRRPGAKRIIKPPTRAKVESIVIAEFGPGRFVDVFIGPFLADVLDNRQKQKRVCDSPCAYGLVRLVPDERESLARCDGFESWSRMKLFWGGRLPFYGHVFHWRPK